MRYLKYRQDFLHKELNLSKSEIRSQMSSSTMITESLENDITWGGSLLGRLINSIIRKGTIYAKTMRIDGIVKEVDDALLALITIAGADNETKNDINNIKYRLLVEEIYKISTGTDDIKLKLTKLLGDKSDTSGLIQVTIGVLKTMTFDKKDELLEKLKKFREALLKIEFEPEENEEELDSNNVNDQFYLQTISLLKSIVELNSIILNKKVKFEDESDTSKENKNPIKVGSEYKYNGKIVKVVDIQKTHKSGSDKKWLTEDDVRGPETIEKGLVLVIWKDTKTNTYLSNAPSQAVDPKKLLPINESYLSIFEDIEVSKKETQAKSAWTKLLNAWNKSGITKVIPRIGTEDAPGLIKKAESGEKVEKGWINNIGKQLVDNESTIGAPIKFEELIKESTIPTSYSDIPKAISLVGRIILAFKGDIGLLGSLGEANKCLKTYIESFDQMKKLRPSLKKEENPKNKEDQEEIKNDSKLFNFSKFLSINEDDDIEMETEDDETVDSKENREGVEQSTDAVKTEWYKEFKEGEEKEWKVDEKKLKEVQEKTDQIGEKGVVISVDDNTDKIIRIVNLFDKAYKLYATDTIPSGRPDGRISQKTFREYTYIGKSDSNEPDWQKDKGPGKGPWAANVPFEKWEKGIMKILENTKYRKVLANSKFKNVGPNQKEGSGKTLFTFINDMLGTGGKDKDFRSKRHRLMTEYFNGKVDPGPLGNNDPKKVSEGEPTDPTLRFWEYSKLSRQLETKGFQGENGWKKEFVRISYKDGDKTQYLIGYIYTIITEKSKFGLVLKFHKSIVSGQKQSIITSYLKDRLVPAGDLKLDENIKYDKNAKLYVGVIDITKNIRLKPKDELTLRVAEIIGDNRFGSIEDMKIKFQSISGLARINEERLTEAIKVDEDKITENPPRDITNIQKIKDKFDEFVD